MDVIVIVFYLMEWFIRMTMEVNDYVVDNIGSLLYQQNIDEVKGKLENWYSNSIDFMNRCISFLDKSLPQYLHASLLGNSFQFNEDTSLTHALNKYILYLFNYIFRNNENTNSILF